MVRARGLCIILPMQKNILVTGVNGFVGHHLASELATADVNVIGVGHDTSPSQANSARLADYMSVDLTDLESVKRINLSAVDAVIHLAGLPSVAQSFAEPARFLSANTNMSINLLQHALDSKASSRFVVISSGAVYESKQPLPITESGQVTHTSPYSVSKLAVEMMSDYYRSRGLDVVIIRPFNHIGPGQGPGFIVPDLLVKLQAAKARGEPVVVGDLGTRRDYTDVRDVARAYTAVALSENRPKEAVYNVCSGRSLSGNDILEALAKGLGYNDTPAVQVDESLLRPNDARDIYGDNSRIRDEFGWQPQISLQQTIKDILAA